MSITRSIMLHESLGKAIEILGPDPDLFEYRCELHASDFMEWIKRAYVNDRFDFKTFRYTKTRYSKNPYIEWGVFTLNDHEGIVFSLDVSIPSDINEYDDEECVEDIHGLSVVFEIYYREGKSLMYEDVHGIFVEELGSYISDITPEFNLGILCQDTDGLIVRKVQTTRFDVSLADNYTDGFAEKYEYILDELVNSTKGVVVFGGDPGTGKTMCLRKMICDLSFKKKNIIFMPSNVAESIGDPTLVSILMEHGNSVIIIEDADNVIQSRSSGNMAVANLLSVADGLLSDVLSMQVVVTFNTRITNVDPALLREGRLIGVHSFRDLPAEKATRLSKKLGFDVKYEKPTSLAKVYNPDKKFQYGGKSGVVTGFRQRTD